MSQVLRRLQQVIPVNETLTDRWDREWLAYFLTEDARPFLLNHQELKIIDEVKGKKPVDVYHTRLVATEEVRVRDGFPVPSPVLGGWVGRGSAVGGLRRGRGEFGDAASDW